ncbi:hypothetical protein FHS35_006580 [Streptomyces umbrinus]|nr:hypothetical protein [Streptomyces umbrinus]GHH59561.1 hypothetical protein GCM10018775_71030 [Streptomyces umbrinus]
MAMAYIVCVTVSRRNGERPSTAERIQVASLSAAEPVLGTYRSGIGGAAMLSQRARAACDSSAAPSVTTPSAASD